MIDTQAPLRLRFSAWPFTSSWSSHLIMSRSQDNRQLVLDLLSVHLVRHVDGSTIISFHPKIDHPTTPAAYLHERIRFAGRSGNHSMYIGWVGTRTKCVLAENFPSFPRSYICASDLHLACNVRMGWSPWRFICTHLPTREHLLSVWSSYTAGRHDFKETRVISTSNTILTQELHVIRAHQLHYSSLLEDFQKTVDFIGTTRNPAMDSFPPEIREHSAELMKRECSNLKNEINRLEMGRKMQDKRLRNVMNLVRAFTLLSNINQLMSYCRYLAALTLKTVNVWHKWRRPPSRIAQVRGHMISLNNYASHDCSSSRELYASCSLSRD